MSGGLKKEGDTCCMQVELPPTRASRSIFLQLFNPLLFL
jgi:hypothetical protein